ncbi:MAG TPA: ATP-binding protein [Anaerolineae bacterium]|nr:ATP-binding protein [Anaerolineae bacterium]
MPHSIRWRIALPHIALILASALGLGYYLSGVMHTEYLDMLDSQLHGEARLVAEAVAPVLQDGAPGLELGALTRRTAELTGARVTIISPGGVVLADSEEDPAQMDNHLYRVEVQDALNYGSGSNVRYSLTLGYELLYVAVPIGASERVLGVARLALPLEPIQHHVRRLRQAVLIAALLTTAVATVLALLLADRITQPLRRLIAAIRRMESGDLSARVMPSSNDEIGELCLAFNQMAGKEQDSVAQLSRERGQLTTILQNTVNGIVITDRQGKVRLFNPAAERILDAQTGAALGQPFAQVARHHKIIEAWQRCAQDRKTHAEPVDLEATGLFLQVVAVPLGDDDGSCLVILQDLSQVRRLETVRSDFVGNASQELTAPLASVRALVDTLREGAEGDPEAARRLFDQLDAQLGHIARVVAEMLELARLEGGGAQLRLAPEPAHRLVTGAVERLASRSRQRGVEVAVETAPDLPPVLCDRERLEQVLVNLIDNAVTNTDPGGRVTVSATFNGSEVVFAVRDSGEGIAAEDLPRVFERFYGADRWRAAGGTGLGLSISKHTVQTHGGRIWAESATGQGRTFLFAIPATPANGNNTGTPN